tara:strand:- start:264 stop:641 length:378 start_codon:yes stop_codon:yes gene_type:complete
MKDNGIDIIHYEKAIADKYGDEAVQNPRNNWNEKKEKEYIEQLKKIAKLERETRSRDDLVEHNGVLISKKLFTRREARICNVCEVYSFSTKDDLYMNKFECCFNCYIQHVEGREEKWLKKVVKNE